MRPRAKVASELGIWAGPPGRERPNVMWRIADLIEEQSAAGDPAWAGKLARLPARSAWPVN